MLRHLGSKTALEVEAEPAVVVKAAHLLINHLGSKTTLEVKAEPTIAVKAAHQ